MKHPRLGWTPDRVAAVVLISFLAWDLVHATQRAPRDVAGRAAPDLTIRSLLDRREICLAAQRGTPVLLSLWASWWVPCRQEAPVLDAAARLSLIER